MPESTDDRPTRSHEFIMLFAKATANTYWTHRDGRGAREQPEADYRWVREIQNIMSAPTASRELRQSRNSERGILYTNPPPRVLQAAKRTEELSAPPPEWQAWYEDREDKRPEKATGWRRVNLWTGHRYYYDADAVREASGWGRVNNPDWQEARAAHNMQKHETNRNAQSGGFTDWSPERGRNLRDVWTIPTHSFPEAHFATFPSALVERPIKAGTSERGCCATCGAPWERVVSMSYEVDHEIRRERPALQDASGPRGGRDDTFVGSK